MALCIRSHSPKAWDKEDRAAIQQLACLGNVVEISTMRLAFGKSEREIHTSLLEGRPRPTALNHNIVYFLAD